MGKTVVIPSDLKAARKVAVEILTEVERFGYPESSAFAIRLALEEGLNNAIRHGNGYDPDKTVDVSYDVTPQRVAIAITDQGQGFDPTCVPDPTADENLHRPCGRGIMLIRAYMDDVSYNARGNQLRMVKNNA